MHASYRQRMAQFVLLLFLTISSLACTAPRNNSALDAVNNDVRIPETANSQGVKLAKLERLNIAVIPHRASAAEEQKKIDRLADYLQTSLGLPVKISLTKDYDTSIDLLVEGKVEMAYLGPFSYVKAKERNPELEPIVAHIEKSTGRPWYTSTMIVNTESGIENLADLKGKRFGFVSKSSTSGYLFPLAYLQTNGLNPESDFIEVIYADSHDRNAALLAEGKVDAIAVNKSTYILAQKSGVLPEPKYRLIWESEPIPSSPIVISSQLPETLKFELKKALINAPTGLIAVGGIDADGYTLVQDEDYEVIRKLQQTLKMENP